MEEEASIQSFREMDPRMNNILNFITVIFVVIIQYGSPTMAQRRCSDGKVYWELTNTCYTPETRGPCPRDFVIIEKPQGPICIPDFRGRIWKNRHKQHENAVVPSHKLNLKAPTFENVGTIELKYVLPSLDEDFTPEEKECFERDSIFWPYDQRCYPLLHRGPCKEANEWLVLQQKRREFKVVCRKRRCPCTPQHPELCEVKVKNHRCECVVALAAAQDGICDENEQLLVNPYGQGTCGCLRSPVHLRWPSNDLCYEIYSQGPCPINQTLQYSPVMDEPLCVPNICPDDLILWPQDGRCYSLNTRGPCMDPNHILKVDSGTMNLACMPIQYGRPALSSGIVKRVFDIIPSHLQNQMSYIDNSDIHTLQRGSCFNHRDSRGACRNTVNFNDPRIGKRYEMDQNDRISWEPNRVLNPFLVWLRNFRP